MLTGETFHYAGHVVNANGNPVVGAEIVATYHYLDGKGMGYIDSVTSDARGRFAIDRAKARSGASPASVAGLPVRLAFNHPNYAFASLEDLQTFRPEAVTQLKVTLPEGRSVQGQVVDTQGRPVAHASVEITFGDDDDQRRGILADAQGHFAFHGLPEKVGTIQVLTVEREQPPLTGRVEIDAMAADTGSVVVTPIALLATTVVHEFLGMKLVDVDESLQAAFHLWDANGVLVLDPGNDGHGLELQRGDSFFIVGKNRIQNFAEFKAHLLALRQSPAGTHPQDVVFGDRVRVVWSFRRPEFAGTNTQYLALSAADVQALSA